MIVAGTRWRVARQCQRKLRVQIRGADSDWVWFVKGNQPDVLDSLKVLFENEPLAVSHSSSRVPPGCDFKTAPSVEKAHGQLEERVITISSRLDEEYLKWPGVAQVFKLES